MVYPTAPHIWRSVYMKSPSAGNETTVPLLGKLPYPKRDPLVGGADMQSVTNAPLISTPLIACG